MSWFKRSSSLNPRDPFPLHMDAGVFHLAGKHRPAVDMSPEAAMAGQGTGRRIGISLPSYQFRRVGFFALLVMGVLLARAGQLQIVRASDYHELAEGNRVRSYTLPSPRGIVNDRTGQALIQNIPTFTLEMIPADIPKDPDERRRLFTSVADQTGILVSELLETYNRHPNRGTQPVPIDRGIPFEQAMRLSIESSGWKGFRISTATTRQYATSATPSLSHILGYTGIVSERDLLQMQGKGYRQVDEIGKSGIERGLESLLRGEPGALTVEVDAHGRELSVVSRTEPTPGANVTLSLDAEFQRFAEERLRTVLQKIGKTRGSIVAIDPESGGIRALISWPSFDSNSFARRIDATQYARLIEDKDEPLFPRATSGEFPSGSTFKPFVAYAALKEGVVTEHTSFVSTGGISIGPWYFPDWKPGGHGITDVRKALAESVNTYFYIVGGGYDRTTGLGVERLTSYARTFGFGEKTGIELPGEASGFLPSKDWKEETKGEPWYVGDTYHLAIGQGDLLVTPLQMATATAGIANGGTSVAATLIQGIDGGTTPRRTEESHTYDPEVVRIVREGMRQSVTKGSSRYLSILSENVAGKTGTAQVGGDEGTHAWFIGFGPYEHPTLAVVILLEHGGEGSSYAVPIAKDLFEWWFAHEQD